MTIYQEYLEFALDELARRHRHLGGSELEMAVLDDVDVAWQILSELGPVPDPVNAIAANVSYDAALVLLCRTRGIQCDLKRFARPKAARGEIEASLRSGALDPAPSTSLAVSERG